MKRILVAMLIISMTAGMTLQNVKASDEEVYYSESQMESIAQNYTENESLFEKCLCSDEGIAYWKMMHKMNEEKLLNRFPTRVDLIMLTIYKIWLWMRWILHMR